MPVTDTRFETAKKEVTTVKPDFFTGCKYNNGNLNVAKRGIQSLRSNVYVFDYFNALMSVIYNTHE